MFDEMPSMTSKSLIKVLFNLLFLHHFFLVILLFLSYHSILGSDLGSWPEKVAQISGTLEQHWQKESLDTGLQACESV